MKRIKITLPNGGYRYSSNHMELSLKEGTVFEINAPEIVIEGDVTPAKSTPERIPFDLEAAKAGAAIVTRDGRKVHFVAHDAGANVRRRVLVRIGSADYQSATAEDGSCYEERVCQADLFMAPKKPKVRYLNMSKDQVGVAHPCSSYSYLTKKEAEEAANIADHINWALVAFPITID